MRSRNIKPGFFKNELLGNIDPLYSIIFQGLWCLADREGRLEYRPLRIHVEINPYRHGASTVQALDWLGANNFLVRYKVENEEFLEICNFKKHQQPHLKEAASKIPPPEKGVILQVDTQEEIKTPCKHGASTVQAHLIPDSLIPDSLIPDSLIPDSTPYAPNDKKHRSAPSAHKSISFDFSTGKFENVNGQAEIWRDAYPAIDISTEINKAGAWLVANPKNRKSNYSRFLVSWFARAQDKAPRVETDNLAAVFGKGA